MKIDLPKNSKRYVLMVVDIKTNKANATTSESLIELEKSALLTIRSLRSKTEQIKE